MASKLALREIFDLITTIEDGFLLGWKRESDRDEPDPELWPVHFPQRALQVMEILFSVSENPEFKKLMAELEENENE